METQLVSLPSWMLPQVYLQNGKKNPFFLSLSLFTKVYFINTKNWGEPEFILGERLTFNDHLECALSPELIVLKHCEKLIVPEMQQLPVTERPQGVGRSEAGLLRNDTGLLWGGGGGAST